MTTHPKKTDLEVCQQVIEELQREAGDQPQAIMVDVCSGIATLTGTVDSWARKIAAREAAFRVGGVFDVINEILVCPPERRKPASASAPPDEVARRLRRAVAAALAERAALLARQVTVEVDDAGASVRGRVDSAAEHDAVMGAVGRTPGVSTVRDMLTIGAAPAHPA